SRRRRNSASRCAPTRRTGSGCATRFGREYNASLASSSENYVADDSYFLRVVYGDATPEEIAAIVVSFRAVAAARSRAAEAAEPAPVRTDWNDPARRLRAPVYPGPGAWRRSALP